MGVRTFGGRLRLGAARVCLVALGGMLACTLAQVSGDAPPTASPVHPDMPAASPARTKAPTAPQIPEPATAASLKGPVVTALQGLTIVAREGSVVAGAIPSVRMKEPTVGPDPPIPLEVIARIFRRRTSAAIRACYVQALIATPTLEGVITAQFVVDKEGAVRSAEVAPGLTPELDACVLTQIKQTTFPQPRGGQVTVRYPFNFLRER